MLDMSVPTVTRTDPRRRQWAALLLSYLARLQRAVRAQLSA